MVANAGFINTGNQEIKPHWAGEDLLNFPDQELCCECLDTLCRETAS